MIRNIGSLLKPVVVSAIVDGYCRTILNKQVWISSE